MTEPTEEDVRNLILDAEIAVAAAGIAAWLPQWFLNLTERHHAETQRLLETGDLEAAQVFAVHGPVLDDDGVACDGGGSPYPCVTLRKLTGSSHVWTPMTDKWEPDWVEEYNGYGPCPEES